MVEKTKAEEGLVPQGWELGAMLNGALREDLTKKVTFKSRSKRGESGPSNRLVKEGSRQRRWRCKGPEAGACLMTERLPGEGRRGWGLTLQEWQCRALRPLGTLASALGEMG